MSRPEPERYKEAQPVLAIDVSGVSPGENLLKDSYSLLIEDIKNLCKSEEPKKLNRAALIPLNGNGFEPDNLVDLVSSVMIVVDNASDAHKLKITLRKVLNIFYGTKEQLHETKDPHYFLAENISDALEYEDKHPSFI